MVRRPPLLVPSLGPRCFGRNRETSPCLDLYDRPELPFISVLEPTMSTSVAQEDFMDIPSNKMTKTREEPLFVLNLPRNQI